MKILVTYSSAGAGHLKAAEAVYKELQEREGVSVVFVDALDYTSESFKNSYRGGYSFLIAKASWLWGLAFAICDIPWLQGLFKYVRKYYNGFFANNFEEYLIKEQFDCILSTHFLPTEVSSRLKKNQEISSKLITIITDFDVHRIWLADYVDYYAVACQHTKEKLIRLNVDKKKIVITGIPIDKCFTKSYDISDLRIKLGLEPNVFTVLIATGSFGIGPMEQIIYPLDEDIQVVAICGSNKELYKILSNKKRNLLKVMGLVNNMPEWMAVADVMITKPGGLSLTEALASQLPVIFFSAIPGQEINNVKVLQKEGIGVYCKKKRIVDEINRLKASRDLLKTHIRRSRTLARLDAARAVGDLVLDV